VISGKALDPRFASDAGMFHAADMKTVLRGSIWHYDSLVGLLSEISEETASGALSFAAEIIGDAQAHGETVAWVAGTDSVFYPPDFSERGIDLSAVTVIRAGGEAGALTAAEWILRSAGIGLVIVDAGAGWKVSDSALGRLQKLSENGRAALVFLTRKRSHDPALGSRISLRGCVTGSGTSPLQVVIHAVRDKRSNSSSRETRQYEGPPGMHSPSQPAAADSSEVQPRLGGNACRGDEGGKAAEPDPGAHPGGA
jgi:hypothetical protein